MSDTDHDDGPPESETGSNLPKTNPPTAPTESEQLQEGAIVLVHKELAEVKELIGKVGIKLEGIQKAISDVALEQQRGAKRQGRAEARLNSVESRLDKAEKRLDDIEQLIREKLRTEPMLPPALEAPPAGESGGG